MSSSANITDFTTIINNFTAISNRMETACSRLEAISIQRPNAVTASGDDANVSEAVEQFQSMCYNAKFSEFVKLSDKIGGPVKELSVLVANTMNELKKAIATASVCKMPKANELQQILTPLVASVAQVQTFCEKTRSGKHANHLKTVNEGIGYVGWLSVSPKPFQYIKECFDQSLFYGNRVIKEFKGVDEVHVEWIRAFTGAITDMQEYVKTYHSTGLTWNSTGRVWSPEKSGAPPCPVGAPPCPVGAPPCPVGMPPLSVTANKTAIHNESDRSALFDSLNKGSDVTKGLKKVSADMQTHKNPLLKARPAVVSCDKSASPPKVAPKPGSLKPKPVPVFELANKVWKLENHINNTELVVDKADMRQSVYIYRCDNCLVRISGKVNLISMDQCKKTSVVFDDVMSTFDVVNCQSVKVQVNNVVRIFNIDKTDGCQIYLSKSSLNAELVTAKSSEMNVLIPVGEEGDYKEFALPEQYKTVWNGKKFITATVDSLG